jgi:hypothetical protein
MIVVRTGVDYTRSEGSKSRDAGRKKNKKMFDLGQFGNTAPKDFTREVHNMFLKLLPQRVQFVNL